MSIEPFEIYQILYEKLGKQNWWPIDKNYHWKNKSDPRFEIIVGAILTQNTAWGNVEKALNKLKKHNFLNISKILEIDLESLKEIIQPSGFFNQKASRLKTIAIFLQESYGGDLYEFFELDTNKIRNELLALNGIGPETADSILLYAGNHPVFVIDAYTKRICKRLPININFKNYDDIRYFFEKKIINKIEKDEVVEIFKELHSLIVNLAKNYCMIKPNCLNCPLSQTCRKKI